MPLRTGVVENFTQKFGGGIKIDGKFYDWTDQTRKYGASLKKGDQVQYDIDKMEKHVTFIKLVNPNPLDSLAKEAPTQKEIIIAGSLESVLEILHHIEDRIGILQSKMNEKFEELAVELKKSQKLSAEAV